MFSKRYDFQWLWMFAVWSCTFLSFLDNLFALMQEIIFILILKKKEKRKPITVPYKENEAIAIGKLQMCSTMIVLTFVEKEILWLFSLAS